MVPSVVFASCEVGKVRTHSQKRSRAIGGHLRARCIAWQHELQLANSCPTGIFTCLGLSENVALRSTRCQTQHTRTGQTATTQILGRTQQLEVSGRRLLVSRTSIVTYPSCSSSLSSLSCSSCFCDCWSAWRSCPCPCWSACCVSVLALLLVGVPPHGRAGGPAECQQAVQCIAAFSARLPQDGSKLSLFCGRNRDLTAQDSRVHHLTAPVCNCCYEYSCTHMQPEHSRHTSPAAAAPPLGLGSRWLRSSYPSRVVIAATPPMARLHNSQCLRACPARPLHCFHAVNYHLCLCHQTQAGRKPSMSCQPVCVALPPIARIHEASDYGCANQHSSKTHDAGSPRQTGRQPGQIAWHDKQGG